MHCELIVPALLPQPDDAAEALADLRLPALELWMARSRRRVDTAQPLEQWLAESFGGDPDEEVAAGALTITGSGGEAGEAVWLRADPIHLKLNRDQLILAPAQTFEIGAAEADALAATLNTHFRDELEFATLQPRHWCVRVKDLPAQDLRTETAAAVTGKDINRHLPKGPHAKRWHGVLNEIQMLLHEHPVNAERERRGEPAINSVWLWGAGRLPADAAGPWHSVSADDALACGYAQLAKIRHRPLPAQAPGWLDRLPVEGRHLIVLDQLRMPAALGDYEQWRARLVELEQRWFAPLVEALKDGRTGMLTLIAPDCEELRSFESARNDLRHFWRRPKPLTAYL